MNSFEKISASALLGMLLTSTTAVAEWNFGQIVEDTFRLNGADKLASAPDVRSAANPIAGRYIVVLKDAGPSAVISRLADTLAGKYAIRPDLVFSTVLPGFAAAMTSIQAKALSLDPLVSYVEQDGLVKLSAAQNNPPWGLDRIDQRTLPLDGMFNSDSQGKGAHVYVIDTGVLGTHTDFNGRMGEGANFAGGQAESDNGGVFPLLLGLLFPPRGTPDSSDIPAWTDCQGHGTHVAGTAAGSKYGVAKQATIHAVRVLDCNGSGSTSSVIKGIDWVTANAQQPAVVNMSLGGGASQSIDDAVKASINKGIIHVVAAGNEDQDACKVSPARAAGAITVAAVDRQDQRASFSNFGRCVDLFAPGVDITSAWHTSTGKANTISGTSMAAPHVAGVVAVMIAQNAVLSSSDVEAALRRNAVPSAVGDKKRSPNLLLQMPPASTAYQPVPEQSKPQRQSGGSLFDKLFR